jgi:hypothetical protein
VEAVGVKRGASAQSALPAFVREQLARRLLEPVVVAPTPLLADFGGEPALGSGHRPSSRAAPPGGACAALRAPVGCDPAAARTRAGSLLDRVRSQGPCQRTSLKPLRTCVRRHDFAGIALHRVSEGPGARRPRRRPGGGRQPAGPGSARRRPGDLSAAARAAARPIRTRGAQVAWKAAPRAAGHDLAPRRAGGRLPGPTRPATTRPPRHSASSVALSDYGYWATASTGTTTVERHGCDRPSMDGPVPLRRSRVAWRGSKPNASRAAQVGGPTHG